MNFKIESKQVVVGSVASIYEAGVLHIVLADHLTIDLTDVQKIDCAGISMIYAWIKLAKKRHVVLKFEFSQTVRECMANYQLEVA